MDAQVTPSMAAAAPAMHRRQRTGAAVTANEAREFGHTVPVLERCTSDGRCSVADVDAHSGFDDPNWIGHQQSACGAEANPVQRWLSAQTAVLRMRTQGVGCSQQRCGTNEGGLGRRDKKDLHAPARNAAIMWPLGRSCSSSDDRMAFLISS